MSPTYRVGSWACSSIGLGVPPEQKDLVNFLYKFEIIQLATCLKLLIFLLLAINTSVYLGLQQSEHQQTALPMFLSLHWYILQSHI